MFFLVIIIYCRMDSRYGTFRVNTASSEWRGMIDEVERQSESVRRGMNVPRGAAI